MSLLYLKVKIVDSLLLIYWLSYISMAYVIFCSINYSNLFDLQNQSLKILTLDVRETLKLVNIELNSLNVLIELMSFDMLYDILF